MRGISGRFKRPLYAITRITGRFARDKDGTTAVEFGLLGLPFFAMIAVILETSLVLLASNIFDSALQDTTRQIRTGQAKTASHTIADFRAGMCDRLVGLFDCDAIVIVVREVSSFSAANIIDPVDQNTGNWLVTETYSSGDRQTIMVAEAYYKWETFVNIMGFNLATLSDDKFVMGAARVFRNEPF